MAEPKEHGTIRIGTSGWNYDHWAGPFYPEDLPKTRWLEEYSRHFDAVEVNNTFYNLPSASTLRDWKDTVCDGFVFAVKASRYITHMKKLKDPTDSTRRFVDRVEELGDALGPLLFQLPPRWAFDAERLRAFLEVLGSRHRIVVEPRDRSWFDPEAYSILGDHGASLCIYELAGFRSPRRLTTDLVYVRLHGPGKAYEGSYDDRTLQGWAGALSSWAASGRDVHCYFDNDEKAYAVRNAARLRDMLDGAGGQPRSRGRP